MRSRKQILMLPSWYPTKQAPIPGSFFKEQALSLSQDYDFTVVVVDYQAESFRPTHIFRAPDLRPTIELKESRDGYLELVATIKTLSYGKKALFLVSLLGIDTEQEAKRALRASISVIVADLKTSFGVVPDLVYAMTAQVNGALASAFSRALDVPLVLAEHNPFPLPGTVLSPPIREAIETCATLLVVSQDKARQVLMQNLSCQPVVIGNLVDGDLFFPKKALHRSLKKFIVVAAYNFYKDFGTLFRAVQRLRASTTVEFQVTIVGFSPVSQIDDFNYGSQRFLDLLEEHSLGEFFHLVPKAERVEMPAYYHDADAFLMTSIQEGLPVSALEAAACGLPIFSTRCGGVEDFVDDSVGRLYPVRDYWALATGLQDFLEDRLTFDSQKIRDRVLSLYGAEAFRRRFHTAVSPLFTTKRETGIEKGE